MNELLRRALKAPYLLLTNPRGSWQQLRPYIIWAKSGPIDVDGIRFNVDLSLDRAMYWMYFHSYQPNVVNALRRYLREGDTFLDVGANAGYISAYGMGFVGKTGSVHAFEPVPDICAHLQTLKRENPDYALHVCCQALGDHKGTETIYLNRDQARVSTMVPGRMPTERQKGTLDVPVTTLSDYLIENRVEPPRVVKIDAEGYEFPVLKGFEPYLRATNALPVLVVEISPPDILRLGASLGELSALMSDLGYVARRLDGVHEVRLEEQTKLIDMLFLPRSMTDLG